MRNENLLNSGLLVLRIGIGLAMFAHGLPKLMGGVETWTWLGSTMSQVGINFAPTFWGFLAAFTEAIGGLLFAIGLVHRPISLMLIGMMGMAIVSHVSQGDGFMGYSHALELMVVFVAMFITGPGKYSLDQKLIPQLV
ncbi:MAG: DoxX family protein [Proteiniphilum sp.]|nr:DoxX family protein [Proteiniphilum sp.]